MTTIAEYIRGIEARQLAAQRRESDATTKLKRIVDLADAEGRKRLSEADEAKLDRLTAAKRAAADELKRLAGELKMAREVEREDIEADAEARQVIRPVPACVAAPLTVNTRLEAALVPPMTADVRSFGFLTVVALLCSLASRSVITLLSVSMPRRTAPASKLLWAITAASVRCCGRCRQRPALLWCRRCGRPTLSTGHVTSQLFCRPVRTWSRWMRRRCRSAV